MCKTLVCDLFNFIQEGVLFECHHRCDVVVGSSTNATFVELRIVIFVIIESFPSAKTNSSAGVH